MLYHGGFLIGVNFYFFTDGDQPGNGIHYMEEGEAHAPEEENGAWYDGNEEAQMGYNEQQYETQQQYEAQQQYETQQQQQGFEEQGYTEEQQYQMVEQEQAYLPQPGIKRGWPEESGDNVGEEQQQWDQVHQEGPNGDYGVGEYGEFQPPTQQHQPRQIRPRGSFNKRHPRGHPSRGGRPPGPRGVSQQKRGGPPHQSWRPRGYM